MTDPTNQAVIAGSRGFALALLAPLAERIGTRPRVAAHPAQAPGLCGPQGIVVVEYLGEESLRAIQELVAQASSLRIVAAVADAHQAAVAPLRALGVEPARWAGKPDEVLSAVGRKMTAEGRVHGSAPAPARPPPAASPAPAPRPAQAAKPAVTPARPPPAASPAPAPRPAQAARPAVTPARPPPAAHPAAAPVPPPPKMTPAPAFAAPVPPPAVPAAPAAATPTAGEDLFEGIADDPFAAAASDDVAVDMMDAAPGLAAPSETIGGPWPTNAPGPVEAADALDRGLAGRLDPPGTPFGCVAEVIDGLSPLERAVFAGEPQPVGTEPIRRAAVMRVRVAAALAAAPRSGGEVDAGAVSAFLAEIDALLSEVSTLAAGAPADLQPSLEAVRNALVKEAIDFSEAAQRASAGQVAPGGPAPAAAPRARTGRTRVLSETREEAPGDKRRRTLAVVLGISIAIAAAFHGWRFHARGREIPPRPSLPLAPAGSIASDPGKAGQRLIVKPGGAMDAASIRALREREGLKGNEVQEVAPGVVVVKPAAPAAGAK